MGNTKNSAGKRVFNDVYSFPQDSQDLADDIFDFANARSGTSAARQGLPGAQRRVGMLWEETDTGDVWLDTAASGWIPIFTDIFGRMNRANTPVTLNTTSWVDISPNANWTADTRRGGLAAYANGWVIPRTGRYEIKSELRASGAFATAISVNKPAPATSEVKFAQSAAVIQGVIAFASSAGDDVFTAGDVVRLFAITGTGSPIVEALRGYWSIKWLGRS